MSDITKLRRRWLWGNNPKGPFFIVGNGRSGTSVMLATVRKTLNLKYYGEGHLYPLLGDLSRATEKYFNSARIKNLSKSEAHMIHHVKHSDVDERLAKMVRNIFFDVYGTTEFVDKTPGPMPILSLPLLEAAFPTMKIIHMKRRGIEVIRSSLKKYENTDFETHCKIWRRSLVNWDKVEPDLNVPHITIDQHALANDTEACVRKLETFLGLTDQQAKNMLEFFQNDRPQSSGNLNTGDVSLETAGWTQEQMDIFRRIGNKIMIQHGWSETEDYYL